MTYYIVKFHADGGQACVPGVRRFTSKSEAEEFAGRMRNEPGHTCVDHTHLIESPMPEQNRGAIYPEIANIGR